MYEDEPQDKVHDVLARGGVRRPSARAAGDRPRRGDLRADRWTTSPPTTTAATCRPSIVVAAAGNLEHEAIEELAERYLQNERERRRPAPAVERPPASRAAVGAVPREGHRAVPHLHRRPRASRRNDDRRFALAILDAILGGSTLLAPVPGGAGEARPRVLGLLVVQPVHRHRAGRRVRRHARGQRRQGARGDRRRAATRICEERGRRRGAEPRPRAREGPAGAVDGVDREPHVPARPLGPDGHARCCRSTRRSSGSRRSTPTQISALARELYPPAQHVGCRRSGATRRASAPRWRRSAPELATA